jgi:hypothetical protein
MVGKWYAGRGSAGWEAPADLIAVEMDRVTGLPADATTTPERRYLEHFLAGTEPGARLVDPMRIFAWGPLAF